MNLHFVHKYYTNLDYTVNVLMKRFASPFLSNEYITLLKHPSNYSSLRPHGGLNSFYGDLYPVFFTYVLSPGAFASRGIFLPFHSS